jgi:hypothetical protein
VGHHGGDARAGFAMCVLSILVSAVPRAAQAPAEFQDLLSDLVAKIVAAVPSGTPVSVSASSAERADDGRQLEDERLEDALTGLLRARGVGVVAAADGVVSLRLACLRSLRDRSCLAEIHRGTATEVVVVAKPQTSEVRADERRGLRLDLRPLFAQRAPILDVVLLDQRVLVLDPASITLYRPTDAGWEVVETRALPAERVWPRDVRGRLLVEGDRIEAFLPGVTCAGILEGLTLTCTEGRRPWPLGIENVGLDARRNDFATPEGLGFIGAAALGADAGARWLVAERTGALTLLDDARALVVNGGRADDVVLLAAPCETTTHVVTASRADGRDALQLHRVTGRQVVPASPPFPLSGSLTVLWPTARTTAATAVVHDPTTGRHEAFLASIACSR